MIFVKQPSHENRAEILNETHIEWAQLDIKSLKKWSKSFSDKKYKFRFVKVRVGLKKYHFCFVKNKSESRLLNLTEDMVGIEVVMWNLMGSWFSAGRSNLSRINQK